MNLAVFCYHQRTITLAGIHLFFSPAPLSSSFFFFRYRSRIQLIFPFMFVIQRIVIVVINRVVSEALGGTYQAVRAGREPGLTPSGQK